MERQFGPGPISNVALYLQDDVDAEATVDLIRARFPAEPLQIRSNQRLRTEVLAIVDQTFAITRILQGMSLIVAATGIALTLVVIARERLSELAVYRALGATRRQIFRIFVGKGLAMGAVALILGSIGGVILAGILIYVVNRSYFGWTIQFYWPAPELAQQAATIVLAALIASLFPALRASRVPATELSRDDL
jgi:putative ABC transport system permease protein